MRPIIWYGEHYLCIRHVRPISYSQFSLPQVRHLIFSYTFDVLPRESYYTNVVNFPFVVIYDELYNFEYTSVCQIFVPETIYRCLAMVPSTYGDIFYGMQPSRITTEFKREQDASHVTFIMIH